MYVVCFVRIIMELITWQESYFAQFCNVASPRRNLILLASLCEYVCVLMVVVFGSRL